VVGCWLDVSTPPSAKSVLHLYAVYGYDGPVGVTLRFAVRVAAVDEYTVSVTFVRTRV
jgi:hypothetical protein